MNRRPSLLLGLGLTLAALAPNATRVKAPDAGTSYRVPYRLTLTNHYLVRVKLNGKGPFNFLVDTGAPFLFVGTEAAKKAGIVASKDDYWTKLDRLELEGGADLKGIKARVEDPFQLVGMNALGLPGASIDGILGYTILARYRMEFDPTKDRMTWTRLDFEPVEPFVPKNGGQAKQDPEVQAMNAMGPMMKLMSVFVGKQPEDVFTTQGLIGVEVNNDLKVVSVLPDSPAARVGLKAGDLLKKVGGKSVSSPADAHAAILKVRPGDKVAVVVDRDGATVEAEAIAAEGF